MKLITILVASWLMLASTGVLSEPLKQGEGIVQDPVTGDYTATYWDEDSTGGEFIKAVLSNATKIQPIVKSSMSMRADWDIDYRYRVSNGKGAQQGIIDFSLYGLPYAAKVTNSVSYGNGNPIYQVNFFDGALITPNVEWYGSGARAPRAKMTNLGWHFKLSDHLFDAQGEFIKESDINYKLGLQPGASLKNFGLSSADLPGVHVARLKGNVGWGDSFRPRWETDSKSDIFKLMEATEKNNFVPYEVAAPLISVPTPFAPAIVLDNLRTHVATWPSKQLADATFAAQLDAELLTTANAYRTNQPEVARDHIEILLDLIRREHKDIDHDDDDEHDNKRGEKERARQSKPILIDRLAARVLDFDLKYVLKRMKKDDDENERR